MVKLLAALVVVFIFSIIPFESISASNRFEVIVNGRPIISNQRPVFADEVLMLPLHPIAEALGLVVSWDEPERRVDIGGVYSILIDHPTMTPAPTIMHGRTFVPITFFYDIMSNLDVENLDDAARINSWHRPWTITEIPDLQINLWTYPLDPNMQENYKTHYNVLEHEGGSVVAIWTDTTIRNFELIEVGLGTYNEGMLYFYPGQSLYTVREFTPERPFAFRTFFGTMPLIAVTFIDENGVRRYFTIQDSRVDGSLHVSEFPLDVPNPF